MQQMRKTKSLSILCATWKWFGSANGPMLRFRQRESQLNALHKFTYEYLSAILNLYHHFVVCHAVKLCKENIAVVNTLCVCEREEHVRHSRIGMWVNIAETKRTWHTQNEINSAFCRQRNNVNAVVLAENQWNLIYLCQTIHQVDVAIYPESYIYNEAQSFRKIRRCCHTRCAIHSNISFDFFAWTVDHQV